MRKQIMTEFTGGFILKEQKEERGSTREHTNKYQWQGESVREESLSDPPWHRRPPKKKQSDVKLKPDAVKDARKNINENQQPCQKLCSLTQQRDLVGKRRQQ